MKKWLFILTILAVGNTALVAQQFYEETPEAIKSMWVVFAFFRVAL